MQSKVKIAIPKRNKALFVNHLLIFLNIWNKSSRTSQLQDLKIKYHNAGYGRKADYPVHGGKICIADRSLN